MIQVARPEPRFKIGQLVGHRRYGYRGVIVAFDFDCRAEEAWYRRNRTQPDRNQAWYHVLMDGTGTVTYAAEENLCEDNSSDPIDHPLVDEFFTSFAAGCYIRNKKPWFGW